jgi:hypothetical protein
MPHEESVTVTPSMIMRSLFRLEIKGFLLLSVNTLFNGCDTLADCPWEWGVQTWSKPILFH